MSHQKRPSPPERLPVILVVDDNAQNLELIQAYLEDVDCRTVAARDGIEALDLVAKTKPDLVLLDLIMPLVSGEEVLEQMAGDPQLATVPVIVITTRDMMPETAHRNHIFIQKPFAPAEVRQLVCETLKLTPPAS